MITPIRNYKDLKRYNDSLCAEGLPSVTLTYVSLMNDVMEFQDSSRKVSLTEVMIDYFTRPSFYFENPLRLSKLPFDLYYALVNPDGYLSEIMPTVNNSNMFGIKLHIQIDNMELEPKDTGWTLIRYLKDGKKVIYIPKFVNIIGEGSFKRTKDVEKVVCLNDDIILEDAAFQSCLSLKMFISPSGIKKLGRASFRGCYKLNTVKLNDNITEIPTQAFEESGITKIKFPCQLIAIGIRAFSQCVGLEQLDFSECKHLSTIEKYAFSSCNLLYSVKFNKDCPLDKIQESAFYNINITKVEFPKYLHRIERHAFYNCIKLNIVDFSETKDVVIEGNAFISCYSLSQLIFPKDSHMSIDDTAFDRYTINSMNIKNAPKNIMLVLGSGGIDAKVLIFLSQTNPIKYVSEGLEYRVFPRNAVAID